MDNVSSWFAVLRDAASDMVASVIAYIPSLLGAVLLLLAGWIIGRLARAGTKKAGEGINRLLNRFVRSRTFARIRLSPRAVTVIGNIVFWLILLFFITAATNVAELTAFSNWLAVIVGYLPTLLAGGLIILAGYLFSRLVRDIVAATIDSAGIGQADIFGLAAQGATFLTALVIGIEQIGIDVSFLVTIIAIVVATTLAGLSLAFGLGARTLVSNLIGAHHLRQHFQAGQHARIGDVDGQILELTATNIVLATADGRMTIPAKAFNEETMVLLTPSEDDA